MTGVSLYGAFNQFSYRLVLLPASLWFGPTQIMKIILQAQASGFAVIDAKY
jgi:hypothetical protein